MTVEINEQSASELVHRFTTHELSPLDALEACLERIDELNGTLNAFCLVDEASAREQAHASERRYWAGAPCGVLDGVPVAIKDVVLTRGWPTRRGSRLVDPDQAWGDDAPAVERLRSAGAVLVGKTTTPEFGWKAVTDSPLTGVTRNPVDRERTSGGSSGGSAAAVAARMVPLALGTDGAGSIRIPAAFCGVVGLKPTFGVVPAWPPSPFGTIAHLGPIARSTADAALFIAAVRGTHLRDPFSVEATDADQVATVRGLRIAYCPGLAGAEPLPGIERLTSTAVERIAAEGGDIVRIDSPIASTSELIGGLFAAGAAQVASTLDQQRRDELDPGFDALARVGQALSAVDYLELSRLRLEVAIALAGVLDEYDLLITPTMPIVAFEAGRDVPSGWPSTDWTTWTPYTPPFNLSQQPAITLPCGLHDGLPVGLQLVGRRFSDARLLAVSSAIEQIIAS